ncbi:MAG: RDD family protein [Verrucomicrobiaceae bacterium]|nr:MAG: RDD family protein [Verrucomicrobiaceae bacterium]
MTSELKIRTPEGIVFSYTLAGPITRCLAWLADLLVTIMFSMLLGYSLSWSGVLAPEFAQALTWAGFFVITLGYGVVTETVWRGQTLGKRALRLRVMDAEGMRLQFYQVLLRNLLRAVDMLPLCYLFGGTFCLFSRRAQRIGDLVAGTVVVHNPHHSEPDLEQLLGTKYNSLRAHPHLVARLRQRISPEEARLALEALVRREVLAPAARVELFHALAEHFDRHVSFPAEVRETQPDEQFVRNVADLLFRTNIPPAGSLKENSTVGV